MNSYKVLKEKQQKEVNEFPMVFAFSNKQFDEAMEKLGLKSTDTDKIFSIGLGGFIKKEDSVKLQEMMNRHDKEIKEAMQDDQFAYDAFYYELGNHEFIITYDTDDAICALGYTPTEINNNKRLLDILKKAVEGQREWYNNNK